MREIQGNYTVHMSMHIVLKKEVPATSFVDAAQKAAKLTPYDFIPKGMVLQDEDELSRMITAIMGP